MSYDHSKKIGNEGDLVKHIVLYNCARYLLENHPTEERKPFVYFECHAGRPHYILPGNGGWKNGIGSLINSTTIADRKEKGFVESFCNAHLQNEVSVGMQYFGSSNIVFRAIRTSNLAESFKLILHDTDTHVIDDLTRYFAPWINRITFNRSCGYLGVRNAILDESIKPSLVLIDPPSLETKEISSCIKLLQEKKIPYICWTPRSSAQNPSKSDRAVDFHPTESKSSSEFGQLSELGKHIGIVWENPTGHTNNSFGCRLTVSEDLYAVSKKCATEVVDVMSKINPKKNGKTYCWKLA